MLTRLAGATLFPLVLVATEGGVAREQKIIDVHVHAMADDDRWAAKLPNPATGQAMTARDENAHRAATFAAMERYHVVKAVTSGGSRADYEAVLRWHEHAPDQIVVAYGFDDPAQVDTAFLRREHAAGRLKVIGEIGAQYEGLAPTDPGLEPIFALAEELDVPVAYHMHPGPKGAAYHGSPKLRASLGRPLLLEDVLVRHPRLRLYVMHAGWPMLDEMVALLHAHPQVYVDVGVIAWTRPRADFHHYLRRLVDSGFGDRILFGSDQMVWPEAIGLSVEAIEAAEFLTAQQRSDIFYGNAVRFFRLDGAGAR